MCGLRQHHEILFLAKSQRQDLLEGNTFNNALSFLFVGSVKMKEGTMKKIYQLSCEEVLKEVNSGIHGISEEAAKQRLEIYGKNVLTNEKKESVIQIFLKQFMDLLVIVLIIASMISMAVGEVESATVILIVIIMNAALGTIQSVKAQKSLEGLKKLSTPYTRVNREGVIMEVLSDEIVVGDIVYVEAGDIVSADGRIIESNSLQINEASLTGEVESVEKSVDVINEEDCAIGDQKNMAFSSGLVTYGRGVIVVSATGMDTEIGRIADLMNQTKEKRTPLQQSLDDFSKKLSMIIILICILVFALNIIRQGSLLDSFMFAVALAVAAIPEALASIVTIVLSISTQKMVKEHAIMKNINAVETLGCVSVICSDKTGTLTQNKMSVEDIYMNKTLTNIKEIDVNQQDYRFLSIMGALCNDATITNEQRIGDPTELAFIDLIRLFNTTEIKIRQTYERLSELPFDSQRKMMSTVHEFNNVKVMFVKGAPDVLLTRCSKVYLSGNIIDIDEDIKDDLYLQNEAFAKRGQRVLSFAYKVINQKELNMNDENDLIFVGLVSMIDPPRVESKEAVKNCFVAGIKPIMITGDHKVTAKAIAKRIGIFKEGDLCIDGKQLNAMSDQELNDKLAYISVYARVAPEHKIRIVDAWQKKGNNVAMTGDGVNDAPALKKADIGIAMGITGTEVSKDAASMILSDDNFSTIVKAVVSGRNVYANIKNAIAYLLSGNFSGILSVLYCSLLALPLPFMPVHLLFINLVTDSLPAIAIGMEPSNAYLLYEKPRNQKESILNKEVLKQIGFEGVVIALSTMVAYYIGLQINNATASTFAFATLCLARLFHGFNCRGKQSIFKLKLSTNKYSIYAFVTGYILLNIILLVPALHSVFAVSKIATDQILMINALAFIPTVIIQFKKWVNDRK